MPLIPAFEPAIADDVLRLVRFVMKDGEKTIVVLVSNVVLDDVDSPLSDDGGYFLRFEAYRNGFEHIASEKYDKGYVEADGSVCIRLIDLPPLSAN